MQVARTPQRRWGWKQRRRKAWGQTLFDIKKEYRVFNDAVLFTEFHLYPEDFVVRPPYQRKSVWGRKRRQELLDSIFRGYYVPRIVLREVRLSEDRTVREVIDGQQRIDTVMRFLANDIPLPKSLENVDSRLPGTHYEDLPAEIRRFADKLSYDADVVTNIDDPSNSDHQRIATEIFWRLQLGESLNYMEVAHARISSLSRNFVVHHADDIRFDYEKYKPLDDNPNKHPFFRILNHGNNRMDHLALLTRLLIFEENDGPADVKNSDVTRYIDTHQTDDGIGNLSFQNRPHAKAVLGHLNAFHGVFADDPMLEGGGVVKELRVEYFIISMYLLLRRLRNLYVFGDAEKKLFHDFLVDFHARWKRRGNRDTDTLYFSDHRQQSSTDVEMRHMILRQMFFEYASDKNHEMQSKDTKRAFDESERIILYRANEGRCQQCLREEKPDAECRVPWHEFDADHVVPHSHGGRTILDNAELLCRHHNRSKGASIAV